MKLVFDPGIQALGQDGVNLAGFRSEGQAVERVERSLVFRQSRSLGFRRFGCGAPGFKPFCRRSTRGTD